jgi:hypothetical protein
MTRPLCALALSGAIAIAATTAVHADGPSVYHEPVLTPEIIVEDTSSSAGGIVVPLMLLVLIATVVASGGGDEVVVSDARVKTDIVPLGVSANGLPLYQYRYIGHAQVFEGVMAQDVQRVRPEAIMVGPGGILQVDYGMLGLELRRVH